MAINDAFDEVTASTFAHRKKSVTDNITGQNALLNMLREKNRIRTDVKGGTQIEEPVILMPNGTVGNFSGFQAHNINESEVSTNAAYQWSNKFMYVVASGPELRMNSGFEAVYSLSQTRIEAAEASAANHMAAELYSDGSVVDGLTGLQAFIQADGQGTVGGINSANFANWRNQFKEMETTNSWQTAVRKEFNALYIKCCLNTDKVDLIMASHDVYNAYEATLQEQIRYMDKSAANGGHETVRYKTAEVVFDTNTNFAASAERAYFLTTKNMALVEHPQAKWEKEAARKPVNADGIIIPFYWMGNLTMKSRRTMGLLKDTA